MRVHHGEWSVFAENSPVQPDLLIALNCGLYAEEYNWDPVISRVVRNNIPFLATDYTVFSATLGSLKFLKHCCKACKAPTGMLLPPIFNPFRRMLWFNTDKQTDEDEGNVTKEKYRISNGYIFGLNVRSPLEPTMIVVIYDRMSDFRPVEYHAHVLSPGVPVRLQGVPLANGKFGTIISFVPESGPTTWKYTTNLETGGHNRTLTVRPTEFVKVDTIVRVDNDYYHVLSHDQFKINFPSSLCP